MSVKLVVFDLAGTTVKDNNDVSKAFQSALGKYGYNIPLELINPIMGYEKNEAITMMLNTHEPDASKITADLIHDIHKDFVGEMIHHYCFTEGIESLPNVEQTFAALQKKGIQVGINTGFSRNIAEAIVNRLQWREKNLINYLVGSDEVKQGRPFPFMIGKMMEEGNINDANDVVKVGDTEVDIREGQNTGCRFVIGVTTGAFSRAQLEPYHPTHIIDNIAEVLDIIKS
ncbi:HAD hydrolase-like protein [Pedobacter hartonius]|uniref:Phosphonatase-like hydrolase n=1 Tax=Pedobacter hartonius TaxID=425514 RepID=A0A1H4DPM6_9SPHI|nr:HAD hydrolase-like protein [Pedobacter hartonius]SEA74468.1 phosphonatase-like hydrolase [Pedobacter hartonius]